MSVTFAEMQNVTKRIFTKGVVEQMITETPFFKSKRSSHVDLGQDVQQAIQTGWSQAIGSRRDEEAMPIPGKPTFLNPVWDVIDTYTVLGITGKAWARVQKEIAAYIVLNKKMVTDSFKATFRDLEFQLFRDGSGVRGVVDGTPVANGVNAVITIDSDYAPLFGFFEDMIIEIWDEAIPALVCEARVNDVDMANAQITVDNLPAPLAGTETIYRKGNRNLEMNGLDYLVNDSTGPALCMGIASTTSKWQSRVYSNLGTPRGITFPLCDVAYYSAMQQNQKAPGEMWMGYGQMTQFVELHQRNLEYMGSARGEVAKINGRTQVLAFGNAECKLSSMCPEDKIFFLQPEDVQIKEFQSFNWITEENAKNIWQKTQGKHAFEATAWYSAQMIVDSRRYHSQLKDLQKVVL